MKLIQLLLYLILILSWRLIIHFLTSITVSDEKKYQLDFIAINSIQYHIISVS